MTAPLAPSAIETRIRAALADAGVAPSEVEWLAEVATRNATIEGETITLPSRIGQRDIAADGAALWLDHFAPRTRPTHKRAASDAEIGAHVNSTFRRMI